MARINTVTDNGHTQTVSLDTNDIKVNSKDLPRSADNKVSKPKTDSGSENDNNYPDDFEWNRSYGRKWHR